MSAYPALLKSLQTAILSGDINSAAAEYKDKPGFPASKQLAVYAESYRARLEKTVSGDYPGLQHFLGEKRFAALVKQYVEATPSHHYNLEFYSQGFADFAVKTMQGNAFGQAVAAFEGTIRTVCALPDSTALDPAWFASLAPESLGELMLLPRSACRLVISAYPVNRYLLALRNGELPATPAAEDSYTIIYRHPYMIQRLECERDEFALLSALAEGRPLGAALEDGDIFSDDAVEAMIPKLSGWFQRWAQHGVLRQPSSS